MKVKAIDELPLFMRVIEYGISPDNAYFTMNNLIADLKLQAHEIVVCNGFLVNNLQHANPNHIIYIVSDSDSTGKWIHNLNEKPCAILPSAISQFNEYEEIVLARQNAEDARKHSKIANRQSTVAIVLALVFGLLQSAISIYALYKQLN